MDNEYYIFTVFYNNHLDVSRHSKSNKGKPRQGEKIMSFEQAFNELKLTKELNTAMLSALGVSFESFIRYAQLPRAKRTRAAERLIKKLEGK